MRAISTILLPVVAMLGATSAGRAQVKLAPKFEPDTVVIQETSTKNQQTLTIQGQGVETHSEESTTTTRSVGQARSDGSLPVAIRVDAIKIQLNLPGGLQFQYDSKAPEPEKADDQLAFLREIFELIAGSSYTVVVDKDGQAVAVEGLDDLLQKSEQLSPPARDMLKGRLDVEQIKAQVAEQHEKYPKDPVREGDTWKRTEAQAIGGGQTLTFEKTYEYLGTIDRDGQTLDKISVKADAVTYTMDPDAPSPLRVEKSDLKVDSSDGTILFDRSLGRSVEESLRMRIKGSLSMSLSGQALPATLDLTLESQQSQRKP